MNCVINCILRSISLNINGFANLDKEIYQLFNNALPYSLSQSLDNNINYLSLMSLALVFKNSERHHKDSSDTVVHTKNISNIYDTEID